MSKNLSHFIIFLGGLVLFFTVEVVYLNSLNLHIQDKKTFVKHIGLPDLAISTEAKYIRHRSLSDIFSIFSEDPEGVSYFISTFVYAPSTILYDTPCKVISKKVLK